MMDHTKPTVEHKVKHQSVGDGESPTDVDEHRLSTSRPVTTPM